MPTSNITYAIIFALGLLIGMIVLMEVGRGLALRQSQRDEAGGRAGLGAIEGSVFALLGLLIAFAFTGAASRFDHRRELIAQEVNAIGTAWMRLDILDAVARTALQEKFRLYLDQRLEAYRLARTPERAFAQLAQSKQTQNEIWTLAVSAARNERGKPVNIILLPALNNMFDIATLRTLAMRIHPPPVLFIMLGAVALVAALMAGYGMSRGVRSWTHIAVFATVIAGSVYIILDLEYPRLGVVTVSGFDQALIELRESMEPTP
jgi:hypothetical protein